MKEIIAKVFIVLKIFYTFYISMKCVLEMILQKWMIDVHF